MRSFSGDRLAEKVRHVPPVSKRKGGAARHATPTIDITTSAEAASIPAWTPIMPLTPSVSCDKPPTSPTAPLSIPVSAPTAQHNPKVLSPPKHEGQEMAGQGQHEAPRVNTTTPSATAATLNTACSPSLTLLEPALGPSSTPALLLGMTHLSNKDSSLSACQTPLQVPPCTPAPFLAASSTQDGPGWERDKGKTTSSALTIPVTNHSSTVAAEAGTPASLQGTTHLSDKHSSPSKCQSPLPITPCNPAPILAASTHMGPGGQPDKGNTTSSALISPATTHSSAAAAEASTPTSACLASNADILVMLAYKGWIATQHFPPTTALGEVVSQWAQQTSTAVNIIKLRHASDEEYLSDDYWWSPLGQIRLVADRVLLLEVIVDDLDLEEYLSAEQAPITPTKTPAATPLSAPPSSASPTPECNAADDVANATLHDSLAALALTADSNAPPTPVSDTPPPAATPAAASSTSDCCPADDVAFAALQDSVAALTMANTSAPPTPASETPAPAATPASPSSTSDCCPADVVAIAVLSDSLAAVTLADTNAPLTPASHPSGNLRVMLVHKGMEVACNSWSGETLLGEVVGAWAHQQQVSVDTLWLRHESDDDYLAQDVWLCDLAALAKQWGDAFVVKVCMPSEDEVPAVFVVPDVHV
ncbi:hypothetical protein ABBQ32_007673 [Trebouxia sp. C0010 RCD-2024]